MATNIETVLSWITDAFKFASVEKNVIVEKDGNFEEFVSRVKIFTDNNLYSIQVREPRNPQDKGYLGAVVSSRKPRAGEDWVRGNDLYDGEFSEETWYRILADIVSCELVEIYKGGNKTGEIAA